MKQIVQNLKNGNVTLANLPVPSLKSNHILIQTNKSLISLGTEKMMLNFGKASWLSKARQQPDKVNMVINKVKTDGLKPTINTVFNKLSTPLPLGYSNAGTVIAVGDRVREFKIGDRVVSNGHHAEVVCVGKNLCAKIPDNVSSDEACFTVVASIGLQGVRLMNPTLGETVVVIGLGLIGLITVQLLKANGCNVIGFDVDDTKVDVARKFGAQAFVASEITDTLSIVNSLTNSNGADGVIITASTQSNTPIESAPQMCRVKGRVVLVGVVGLELNRTEFFKREVSFQVSCSYGPGRYDENYESRGEDYPLGYVRWTEKRNFEAILSLLSSGKISFQKLVTREEDFIEAPALYRNILDSSKEMGILLKYTNSVDLKLKTVAINSSIVKSSRVVLGVIGAGNFTSGVLVPIFANQNCRLKTIASSSGLSSNQVGVKFNFENNTSDYQTILDDKEINTVVISTPHNTHGKLVLEALKSSKNVFVEKPLSLLMTELELIEKFFVETVNPPLLMVGFNRRFSPLTLKLQDSLKKCPGPKAMIFNVNSGIVPSDHWTQNPSVGGGRLLGEGCHFIDYFRFVTNSKIKNYNIVYADTADRDIFTCSFSFEDGSIGTVNYFSNGNKSFPKERFELYVDGKVFVLDNFKSLIEVNKKGRRLKTKLSSQDKGHELEIKKFISAIENGDKFPIAIEELLEVSRISIKLSQM